MAGCFAGCWVSREAAKWRSGRGAVAWVFFEPQRSQRSQRLCGLVVVPEWFEEGEEGEEGGRVWWVEFEITNRPGSQRAQGGHFSVQSGAATVRQRRFFDCRRSKAVGALGGDLLGNRGVWLNAACDLR